ncbi:ferredoxin [Nocardia iowensis]|uniref:Ferredoxin n=1 Tax=Nocardia iowensis TaxID=204891 RepID=A0ABX8RIZ8_NOCIO|nr:ferredoxin [Nocardia iowensis]QXN88879.1 ferredoxin [Nocardia iowensis]
MRIVADRTRCDGHGMCEALAPNLFRVGDDGIVAPRTDSVDDNDHDLLQLAIDSCPVEALRLA